MRDVVTKKPHSKRSAAEGKSGETSYDGTTRIRFGGFSSRVEKSRSVDRQTPLSPTTMAGIGELSRKIGQRGS